jgi:glycosyltransferase involved in cell wall biosynthesis
MASVLCVLLRTPRKRLGVLHLDRSFWQKPFTEDDLHLADALTARGVHIEVIAPHAASLADTETFGAVRVHRFHYAPTRWERLAYTGVMHELVARSLVNKILFVCFLCAFWLATLCQIVAARPHLLHAHWWMPGGLVGALAALVTRVPLVITTHGTDIEMLRRTRWAKPLACFVFARAHAIVCVSTYLREQLVTLDVVDAARVYVVPQPVHPLFEDWRLEIRDSTRQSPISNLVLTVARLTKQKSIDTLIDALAILRARGCDARVKIIGDGPERDALEQYAREANVREYVEFVGALPQAELPAHYASAAVFVLPSIREGVGLVFAEALLCGTPVIGTASGGVTDIIRDGETGLLFPERDARALADVIERVLRDRALAARLVANGAAFVREHFAPERVAAQYLDIYQRVMQPAT